MKKTYLFLLLIFFIFPSFSSEKVPFAGLKLKNTKNSPEITEIIENSPAYKSKLQIGDLIKKISKRKVDNKSDFILNLYTFAPNDIINITISRNKQLKNIKLKLSKRKDKYAYIFNKLPFIIKYYKIKEMGNLYKNIGLITDNINKQLLDFFNAENGVIITHVEKNSKADKNGFKAGDIIYKMNNKIIEHTIAFRRVYDNNNKIVFFIKRKNKKIKINFKKE